MLKYVNIYKIYINPLLLFIHTPIPECTGWRILMYESRVRSGTCEVHNIKLSVWDLEPRPQPKLDAFFPLMLVIEPSALHRLDKCFSLSYAFNHLLRFETVHKVT